MSVQFTTHGKEVLKAGLHFADARSHKAALEIAAALTATCNDRLQVQRARIAQLIDDEAEKRGRHIRRAGRIVADYIRAGFDLADDPAPEGTRARYNSEEVTNAAAN